MEASSEKCAIFIDGGYLDSLLGRWDNFPLDYLKLTNKICQELKLDILRVYYYNCLPVIRRMYKTKCNNCNCEFEIHFKIDENKRLFCEKCLKEKGIEINHINYSEEQTNSDQKLYDYKERFYNKLKRFPRFEVRYGELQIIKGEFKQKGVDVLMSLDIVEKCFDRQIQHAIIIAGDSDFIPAIRKAKDYGTIVHLFCNKNKVNNRLLYEVDELHNLTFSFIQDLKIEKK